MVDIAVPPKYTCAPETKPTPVTVSVKFEPPADAEVWLRPVTVGVTVNVLPPEARVALPFWTVTLGVPANARLPVGTATVI